MTYCQYIGTISSVPLLFNKRRSSYPTRPLHTCVVYGVNMETPMIKTIQGAERLARKNLGDIFFDKVVLHNWNPEDDSSHQHKVTAILIINGCGFRQVACKVDTLLEWNQENTTYSPSREVFEHFLTYTRDRRQEEILLTKKSA